METVRLLEDVSVNLKPFAELGKVGASLNNAGNGNRLRGILEGIRDAIMEYQVCTSLSCLLFQRLMFEPDVIATRYL